MSIDLPFDPFFLFKGSHQQTIMGAVLQVNTHPSSKTKQVILSDGDRLAIEITTPKKWKPTDLTVVMLHGLCGSHKSPYLLRMTNKLKKKGIRSIRVNLRGCGSGKGLARNIYHSGQSGDILAVLKFLKNEMPDSPIILMGFSLGGNIVLKLAGELQSEASKYFDSVMALNAPVDLLASVNLLTHPSNRRYEKYFIRLLQEDLAHRCEIFPDMPKMQFPEELHFYEFDAMVTVPYNGFKDPMDYYDRCSSKYVIPDIKVPCSILLSRDDPIISSSSLDLLDLPNNVQVYKTKNGGHLGYLGHPSSKEGFYWLDYQLLKWIDQIHPLS